MKKLYRVEITMMVMADDVFDAMAVAEQSVDQSNTGEFEVAPATSTPSEWYDLVPYGSDDDLTVGEILKLQRSAARFGDDDGEV